MSARCRFNKCFSSSAQNFGKKSSSSPSLKRCDKEIPLTQTWVHYFCQEIIEGHRSCERNLASKSAAKGISSSQSIFMFELHT